MCLRSCVRLSGRRITRAPARQAAARPLVANPPTGRDVHPPRSDASRRVRATDATPRHNTKALRRQGVPRWRDPDSNESPNTPEGTMRTRTHLGRVPPRVSPEQETVPQGRRTGSDRRVEHPVVTQAGPQSAVRRHFLTSRRGTRIPDLPPTRRQVRARGGVLDGLVWWSAPSPRVSPSVPVSLKRPRYSPSPERSRSSGYPKNAYGKTPVTQIA